MISQPIDCRNLNGRQAGFAILEAYNATENGAEFVAYVDCRVAEVATKASHLTVDREEKRVFVANFLDDTVSVFTTHGMQKTMTFETDPYPHGLYMSPHGRWLIATGYSSDYLRVFDTTTRSQVARIEVGRGSSHVGFLPDQEVAYIACSVDEHLARLDLSTMTCTHRTGLGS